MAGLELFTDVSKTVLPSDGLLDALRCMEERLSSQLEAILDAQRTAAARTETLLKTPALPLESIPRDPQESSASQDACPNIEPSGGQGSTNFCQCIEENQYRTMSSLQNITASSLPYSLMTSVPGVAMVMPGWPETVKPRSDMQPSVARCAVNSTIITSKQKAFFDLDLIDSNTTSRTSTGEGLAGSILCRLCSVGDPASTPHIVFALLGSLFLLLDLVYIPLVLAFDAPLSGAMLVLCYASACYWSLNMCVALRTGFFRQGVLILQGPEIVRNYLRTWFLLDLVLATCDWFSLILLTLNHSIAPGTIWVRLLRLGRGLRIAMLVRPFRWMPSMKARVDSVFSAIQRSLLTICTFACVGLLAAHLLACSWVLCGREAPSDTGLRWITIFEDSQSRALAMYAFAVQWSLSIITGLGAHDVSSTNTAERIFTAVASVLGLAMNTILTSSLFAAIVDAQMAHKERSQKMRSLRQYLEENAIKPGLAMAIQQHASTRLKESTLVTESAVPALELLPSSLRFTLRFEVAKRHLADHGFFSFLILLDRQWCVMSLAPAIELTHAGRHDEIFLVGVAARAAFCLTKGSALYVQQPDYAPVPEESETPVGEGAWMAEGALWAEWIHVGQATATSPCSLMLLHPAKLSECLRLRPSVASAVSAYAQAFHKRVTSSHPPYAPWCTDLEVPFTDWGDIVLSMPLDMQLEVSTQAFNGLRTHGIFQGLLFGKEEEQELALRSEIANGQSVLILDRFGEAHRVVGVVALQLVHTDGSILVHLGNRQDGVVEASCALPGVKRLAGEAVSDAFGRLVRTRLGPVVGQLTLRHVERAVEEKRSVSYGVPSRYIRSVCHASLEEPAEFSLDATVWRRPKENQQHNRFKKSSTRSSFWLLASRTSMMKPTRAAMESVDLDDLADRPVYCIRHADNHSFGLFAWLSQQEYEQLRKQSSKPELLMWLRSLDPSRLPEGSWNSGVLSRTTLRAPAEEDDEHSGN